MIDTKDPLVLEIKIYDAAKGYKKNRIVDGFKAIVKYSNDHHKNVGYLVVFNLDDIEIKITSEDADNTFSNRIIFSNKIYHIIIIKLNFETPASKSGALKVETITKEELVSEL